MASIQLKHLIKRYGTGAKTVNVLHGIDATIDDGEFVVIVGPSGCGKSTLLRMIAGLEEVSEGDICIGERIVNQLEPAQRDIAMVFQNYALYPHMTVFDNMAYGLKIANVPSAEIQARVAKAAGILELGHLLQRKPRELSGGQRQRVALARPLVVEPEILLLDEPLSALDAALKVRMQTVLKTLQRETGITFVYVTHSQSEAFSMADRVIIMSRGKIEQIGTPQEIYRTPKTRFVADFLGSSNIFTGDVVHADAATIGLSTPSGTFRLNAAAGGAVKIGQQATITVLDTKPALSLDRPAESRNMLRAKVIGEEFVGATATIYLETAGGQEIRVQKSHAELSDLPVDIGQELYVSWSQDDGHLVSAA